ncbi:hypothetical protein [Streptomyces xylophagus]|uniref:hypothetical protein n=1 Tax=Streptomyces xylophagus TaxID=285514 RepID=UPI0005B948C6|nr:hypothetical protein [Streptomyces xylophagus]
MEEIEQPSDVEHFAIMQVCSLPETRPFRTDCMGVNYRPRAEDDSPCCWYHAQDWNTLSELAIGLLKRAWNTGLVAQASIYQFAYKELFDSDLERWWLVVELFSPSSIRVCTLVHPYDGRREAIYGNGQHRVQAMKDLRVERTVVLRHKDTVL